MNSKVFILVSTFICSTPASMAALTLGLEKVDGTLTTQSAIKMHGFRFSVASTISLSGLAVFDVGANGWTGSPSVFVGLWDEDNETSPIATVEVKANSAILGSEGGFGGIGEFRYETFAKEMELGPGIYRVAANLRDTDNNDSLIWNGASSTVNMGANLTYLGSVSDSNTIENHYPRSLRAPNATAQQIGANIVTGTIPASAAPEPSSALLAVLGGAGLLLRRRR